MINYHAANIKDGKFKLRNKEQFKGMVANLPDGPYLVILMDMNSKDVRSNQNRYFAQLGEWSNNTGWLKDELHQLVKDELFTFLFGEALSTTVLTSEQWTMVFFNLENFLIRKFENR